jgi:hypothetical protein
VTDFSAEVLAEGKAVRCMSYELRITRRCLQEDLDYFGEAPFEDLAGHEIVKALVNRRSSGPTDTREVSPLTSGQTVYRLAYGDRHRGATWFDQENRVVWLLAYAQHEFEGRGDAFPYFKELDETGRLLPEPADLEQLFRDRTARFAATVAEDAERLLEDARRAPGEEQRGRLGGELGVGVVIVVVEPLEEVSVAIEMMGLSKESFAISLAALFPGRGIDELESIDSLPARPLTVGELGFRLLNG